MNREMLHNPAVSCEICRRYEPFDLGESVRRAVEDAGGWPESVLSAGKILLKPNLLSARFPDDAVTTHPEFIRAVIREIRRRSNPEIFIGDSPAGDYSCEELWEKTGMRKVSEEENVNLLPFQNIRRVEIPGFGTVPVLKELDDFDALVNLPKLKTHLLTKFTGAVKNVYGLVPGKSKSSFHGKYSSPGKISDFLAAFYASHRPDFSIMDAVECMAGNGPSNGQPFEAGLVFASADALALDFCACAAYGYSPSDIRMLQLASKYCGKTSAFEDEIERQGDGWEKLGMLGAPKSASGFLNAIPECLFHPISLLLKCRPRIDDALCIRCGICEKACSQNAIEKKSGSYRILPSKCIVCLCCMEACPKRAINLLSPLMRIICRSNASRRTGECPVKD